MRKALIVKLFVASLIGLVGAVVLLVGGLLSVGFLVTLAYVIVGPDGQTGRIPTRYAEVPPVEPAAAPPSTMDADHGADLVHR
jgi:hypothetical protein